MEGRFSTSLADIIAKLYRLFLRYDAGLVEINPLALTAEGSLIAADCRIEIDDDALFRQQDRLARLGIPVRQERGREPSDWRCRPRRSTTSITGEWRAEWSSSTATSR